jgi:hypothetical protein
MRYLLFLSSLFTLFFYNTPLFTCKKLLLKLTQNPLPVKEKLFNPVKSPHIILILLYSIESLS